MWNGSSTSSDERRPERPRLQSNETTGLLIACLVVLVGCQHGSPAERTSLTAELSKISGEELFRLGLWHASSGDLLRAEQYLVAARRRGHEARLVTYWLVRVCTTASRYHSALAHVRLYLRDHPQDWSLRLIVASIYEALGELEEAQSELERLVRAVPQSPLPHYWLALLYQGREAQQHRARGHLETYLALTPQGPHAEEARAVLDEGVAVRNGPQLVPNPNESDSEVGSRP
jgi:tetratricopeptide (TPR) repeat protein